MAIYRGDGTPTAGDILYDQADLDAAVAAAAASEAAAATSETNAATSETNAAASAAAASTSETNAAASEAAAAASASASAASASAAATSETNAAASEAAAAASYDSFDDRYLGAKASDPALDNDGDPLVDGALYWNTTNNVMRVYDLGGAAWADIGRATANITEWTVTGTTTTFTGNDDNGLTLSYAPGYVMVFQNGVLLDPDDYTATNGTSVVLGVAAESGDTVNIIGFGTFDVSTSYTKTESDARYYTQTQLDAGQLDTRYFTETECNANFAPITRQIKNLLINPTFEVQQRGSSFTNLGSVASAYTYDRWIVESGGAQRLSLYRGTIPTSFLGYAEFVVTTANASPAAGDYCMVSQRIEGFRIRNGAWGGASAQPITIGFWHNHTVTGTYSVSIRNPANNRSYIATYTQATTATWEYATITIPGDQTGTWPQTSAAGLLLHFVMMCGSTYHQTAGAWQAANKVADPAQANALASVSNVFRIGNVKAQYGNVNTPLEDLGFDEELAMCQRYYEKSYDPWVAPGTVTANGCSWMFGSGFTAAAYTVGQDVQFRVEKRASPNFAAYSSDGTGGAAYDVNGATNVTPTILEYNTTRFAWYCTNSGSFGGWQFKMHWVADAEI